MVATTGEINENARKYIGKAQIKGTHRQIFYWPGTTLAEYIQKNWMPEFEAYFAGKFTTDEEEDKFTVVDSEYIEENYDNLINRVQKVKKIVGSFEWKILKEIARFQFQEDSRISMGNLLIELGKTEDYCKEEFNHLISLDLMYIDEDGIMLDGNATKLLDLYRAIFSELEDAGEDTDDAEDIFDSIIE